MSVLSSKLYCLFFVLYLLFSTSSFASLLYSTEHTITWPDLTTTTLTLRHYGDSIISRTQWYSEGGELLHSTSRYVSSVEYITISADASIEFNFWF